MAATQREALRRLAAYNHGIFTTAEAEDLGVPHATLVRLRGTGHLERVGHGVYRHAEVEPDRYTQLAARLAGLGPGSYLADETVLALHDLAQVDPSVIHLVTDRRRRRAVPADTVVTKVAAMDPDDLTEYFGLPSLTVHAALMNCLPRLVPERALWAVRDALRNELITYEQAQQVRMRVLRRRPASSRGA